MIYQGSCDCNRWQVTVEVAMPLSSFNPRICDCDYCQNAPAAIISDPKMIIHLAGSEFRTEQNGDQLAGFYYCDFCGDLLAVGRDFGGQLRGAVNANLLDNAVQLGEPVDVQPRLLSADEKLARWGKLWGQLYVV